ncbi:MAG: hypothetical protein ABI790_02305, partial [Betaproteobacteria bacterium]
MAIAGALEIQMFANVARLTEDMGKVKGVVGQAMSSVERSVNMAKNALGLLGIGLSVGWAVNFIKSSIDATARMKDLGQEAGVTASAISKFEAPARMAGLGLDSVAAAMFKVSKAALEARDPASAAAQALAAIGISTAQLKGLKPDEMFELVARSVAKYADGLEKNNVMQALFGKSGREMNRVVAEIADARKLSATVTDEEAEAADRLGDQLVELKMNSERAWRSIIAEGVPAMNDIVKAFIEGQKQGGLLRGILDGLASAFDKMGGNAAERLARINDQIKLAMENDATRGSRSFFGIESGAAYDVNDLLARRAVLEKTIFDQELAAQDKRATAGLEGKKPTINFDPAANAVAAAAAKKAEAEAIKEAEKALVAYVKAAMDA